jgi:hypothetical protein
MRSAQLARMGRLRLAVCLVGAMCPPLAAEGCSSTSAGEGAADGGAMTPDAQSVSTETPACAAAGGQCKAAASCTALSPETCENGAVCCFDDICASEDASPQVVMASSYDQSCAVDTDCVGVSEGNSCKPCDFNCSNATINAGALAKYTSDTSHFPAVVAFDHGVCPSSCGGPVGLCCLSGKCHLGSPCPFEVLVGSTPLRVRVPMPRRTAAVPTATPALRRSFAGKRASAARTTSPPWSAAALSLGAASPTTPAPSRTRAGQAPVRNGGHDGVGRVVRYQVGSA